MATNDRNKLAQKSLKLLRDLLMPSMLPMPSILPMPSMSPTPVPAARPRPAPAIADQQLDLFSNNDANYARATDTTDNPLRAKNKSGQRQLLLAQHLLVYQLRRSKRRSIGFTIDDEGLRIAAPKWVSIDEIEKAIRDKQRWILTKLHEHQERAARRLQPHVQWQDGAQFPYQGRPLTLKIVGSAADSVVHDSAAATLQICLPAEANDQQIKDRVLAWLQQQAKLLFTARLAIYAEKLDVHYRAFALSSATTRWGSCTADGKIRLNWRLVHFALPLIDYVIAHELAHLREMNHGPRFWATVQSVFPEFAAARETLRQHVPENLPAF
jgi:predicted metal-dependent hydrolase